MAKIRRSPFLRIQIHRADRGRRASAAAILAAPRMAVPDIDDLRIELATIRGGGT